MPKKSKHSSDEEESSEEVSSDEEKTTKKQKKEKKVKKEKKEAPKESKKRKRSDDEESAKPAKKAKKVVDSKVEMQNLFEIVKKDKTISNPVMDEKGGVEIEILPGLRLNMGVAPPSRNFSAQGFFTFKSRKNYYPFKVSDFKKILEKADKLKEYCEKVEKISSEM